MIFYSDLGSKYTSDEFKQTIKTFNITHYFSYKSSPYDNGCIESFHTILETEEVNHVGYLDYDLAQLALIQYIEGWYNHIRIHSSIGYRTRLEMEILLENNLYYQDSNNK